MAQLWSEESSTFPPQCYESFRPCYQFAQESGLYIVMEYTEEQWGQNHFIVRDPEGLLIDIVEHVQQAS